MGRGATARRAPLAPDAYDPQAERPVAAVHQQVAVADGVFDVRVLADLLVRSSRMDSQETHLLSAVACSCGSSACVGRVSVAIARDRGLAAFAPLNPSESRVSVRTFQTVPLGTHATAIVRTDAWGDRVEILVQNAAVVDRHTLGRDGACEQHDGCDASGHLAAAVRAGLRPFEPQGDAYAPADARGDLWLAPFGMPTRLGPARIHASSPADRRVTFTEVRSSGPASFVATPAECTCGRAHCLHRQLLARMTR